MRCKCGFENAADARFCGSCRLALGHGPVEAIPNAAASSTGSPVAAGGGRPGARPLSRARMTIVAAVVVVAAAGSWWLNRHPERYKPDNSGLYPISVNGKYGFMDRSGKTVITPQFDSAGAFSEGLASVRVGNKWGYIDTKGVVAITPQFDMASPFRFERAGVKLGNRFGIIDKDGKYINSPDFAYVGFFSGDLAPVTTSGGVMGIVSRAGKMVSLGDVTGLRDGFTAGLIPASSGGKWGFIDATGKWVIDPLFEEAMNFADGLAPVKAGGRTGYINKSGKFVINPQYDSAGEFCEGRAGFSSGGKVGFIDTKGLVVCDAKFLSVGSFSDGLAPVKTDEGWGFIDRTGKMVIGPKFESADGFQNDLARVTVGGKEAYVTKTGAFVVNPFPEGSANPTHQTPDGTGHNAITTSGNNQASMIENRSIVDTYLGTIGGKDFKLFIEKVEGDNVEGYNVTGTKSRPVKGRIVNKSSKPTGLGGSFTIFKVILTEPGDDNWDGEFTIDLWISDIGRHGEGNWKSFNGKLEHIITIKDRRN